LLYSVVQRSTATTEPPRRKAAVEVVDEARDLDEPSAGGVIIMYQYQFSK
jgi:hypothetical protein